MLYTHTHTKCRRRPVASNFYLTTLSFDLLSRHPHASPPSPLTANTNTNTTYCLVTASEQTRLQSRLRVVDRSGTRKTWKTKTHRHHAKNCKNRTLQRSETIAIATIDCVRRDILGLFLLLFPDKNVTSSACSSYAQRATMRRLISSVLSRRQGAAGCSPCAVHGNEILRWSSAVGNNKTENVCPAGSESVRDRVVPYMPRLFSTIRNIERKLPTELQNDVALAGGLQEVLQGDHRFVVSVIGKAVVARILETAEPSSAPANVANSPTIHSRASIGGRGAAIQAQDMCAHQKSYEVMPRWCQENCFPRFCVPLDILGAARCAVAAHVPALPVDGNTSEEEHIKRIELPLLASELEAVDVMGRWYVRPTKNRAAFLDVIGGATSASKVLHSPTVASAVHTASEHLHSTGGHDDSLEEAMYDNSDPTSEATSVQATQGTTVTSARGGCGAELSELERWLVRNGHLVDTYEMYRVARLMESARWTPVTQVADEGEALLPQFRHLGHVIGTAPHLFELASVDGAMSVRYRVPAQYLTHRRYRNADIGAMQRKVHALRQAKFPQRDKMRRLLREIVEAEGNHPFLDHSVFAIALLDCLPICGGAVDFTAVMNARFSPTQRNCRPVMLLHFFEQYKDLFTITQDRRANALMVSRVVGETGGVDDTLVRKEDDVDGFACDEEVVVSLFERFPARHDPSTPIPYHRVRGLLSLRVQRAVRLRGWAAIASAQGDKIEVVTPDHRSDAVGPASLRTTRQGEISGVNADNAALLKFRGGYLKSLLATYRRLRGEEEPVDDDPKL